MNFKKGDMVRCIDDEGVEAALVHGEVYEVFQVRNKFIDILINGMKHGGFFTSRFESATPKTKLEEYLKII